MSYFDDASLAFLPSGAAGKDGKAYSIKPTDGTGDFTFSRGSNLAATRVGADGLIEKGRENLLTQSNRFDLWNLENVTSGHAGYDGTNDAYLQSGTSRLQRTISYGSGVYTASVFVKAGFSNYVQFRIGSSSTVLTRFELIGNGTILGDTGTFYKSIEPVSGATGWYRISISFNSNATQFRIDPENDSSGTQTTDSSIYIQDAQLEVGLAATEYIESGATTGTAGILEDTPRFDYSNGASCPSLLLEPSRTQLIGQSEYFGGWILSRTSAFGSGSIINDTTSPDGFVNAAYIQQASGQVTGGGVFNGYSYTSGTNYTLSVFAKKKEGRYLRLGFSIGTGNASVFCNFDLQGGIAGSPDTGITPKIEDYGNGWYRCSITKNSEVTGTRNTFLYQSNSLNSSSATPLEGIYIYGAMLESNASYPTSYIPNHSGGTITRAADVCGGAGDANTFNSTEGVLYFEVAGFENANENRYISLSDGTSANSLRIFYYSNGATTFFRKYVNSVQTSIVTTSSINQSESNKIAIRYNSTNFDIFSNGIKISTNLDSTAFPNNALNVLNFTDTNGVSSPFLGNVKQVLTFNTALSDADLATLTTI